MKVTGKDFVRLVLRGERDFAGIKLEDGFDIANFPDFRQFQEYMLNQRYNFFDNPISLRSASLKGLQAKGTYLFSINAANADLENACLINADLRFANLKGANLERTDLEHARMSNAYLQEAATAGANLLGADFHRAHLIGIKNLEKSRGIERAIYCKTRVGANEQRIIENAMRKITTLMKEERDTDYGWLDEYAHASQEFHEVSEDEIAGTLHDQLEFVLR